MKSGAFTDKKWNFFDPLFFMLVGGVLLLNTTGYLDWEIWFYLLQYWPVMLIIWGISLIFGKSMLGKFFAAIISITILLILFYSGYQHLQGGESSLSFPVVNITN